MPLIYGVAQHDGYKSPSEDVIIHTICPNGYEIFGIFDGHGGTFFSKNVSDLIKRAFISICTNVLNHNDFRTLIPTLFETVDTILYDLYPDALGGTTAVLAVITPTDIIVANVGDSAAMLIDTTSSFPTYFTKDHTPDDADERNRILNSGGSISRLAQDAPRINNHLSVSRAFGNWRHKNSGLIVTPTIYIWPRAQTVLALYCDSFSENYSYDESGKCTILNLLSKAEVYKNLQKFIQRPQNLATAAQDAVNSQVEKFKDTLFGHYNGDNTSLFFIDVSLLNT
jgi:serine/threonine protein phosphatase PrpC